jgi:ferric-dicitrate binding protein FerR (iron transport regulator)
MDHKQIFDYLEGKTSPGESWKVREWLANPENERHIREVLGHVWLNGNITVNDSKPDFDQMLDQVHHLINLNETGRTGDHGIGTSIRKLYQAFSKAAAILIIPLAMLLAYYLIGTEQHKREDISNELVLITKPGSRMQTTLPDGTKVWLNDGTTLKYPSRFAKKERKVYIDGEAYFEVVSNPERPFIVENPMMNTRATGTKFNINAYTDDHYFEATLLEGIITLEKQIPNMEMKPGQQVQYNRLNNKCVKEEVDPRIATAWIDGKLILENEPLNIAAKKLSRWYNIEFIIQSPELNEYLLTATIQDEKPEQTIKLIAFALPVKYNIKTTRVGNDIKRTIYLMKK